VPGRLPLSSASLPMRLSRLRTAAARLGWWGRAAPLLAYVAWQIAPVCDEARLRLRDAGLRSGEDGHAYMARFRTPVYADALDRVRAAVPAHEPLYVADFGGNEAYFLHFDLAPRPMIYVGTLDKRDRETWVKTRAEVKARWVLIARIADPGPELVPVADFFVP